MRTPTLLLLLTLLLAAGTTQARGPDPGGPANPATSRATTRDVGPERAAAAARRAFGGTVLRVSGGPPVYRVRVLLEGGRMRTVHVDAASGRILE